MRFVQVSPAAEEVRGQFRRLPSLQQLSALAALHRSQISTLKHARLILRHNGFSGASAPALIERLHEMNRQRYRRREVNVLKRLAAIPQRARPWVYENEARVTPSSSPAQRLEEVRKAAVVAAAKACLRHGAAGGTSFSVRLTRDASDVGYHVVMSSNRTTYGGSYKGWSAGEDHHKICVPADWRVRVERRGLATAGGMLTLDLQPLIPHGDIELFQAVWVTQARGYGVRVCRGVLARLNDEVFHADDVSRAIGGVTAKVNQAVLAPRVRKNAFELTVEAFIERYVRYGDIEVDAYHARESGACEYGINSWCNAVGIDLGEVSVPLTRVLEGFRQRPLIEVRRTVLQAIQEHRRFERLRRSSRAQPAAEAANPQV